jgi:hypothetical protein
MTAGDAATWVEIARGVADLVVLPGIGLVVAIRRDLAAIHSRLGELHVTMHRDFVSKTDMRRAGAD